MSKATYPLELPASIRAAAARLAKEDGVSLNQWIATAVAQKVGVVETAAVFFQRRAGNATPDDLERITKKVPDVPTDTEDRLPPHRPRARYTLSPAETGDTRAAWPLPDRASRSNRASTR